MHKQFIIESWKVFFSSLIRSILFSKLACVWRMYLDTKTMKYHGRHRSIPFHLLYPSAPSSHRLSFSRSENPPDDENVNDNDYFSSHWLLAIASPVSPFLTGNEHLVGGRNIPPNPGLFIESYTVVIRAISEEGGDTFSHPPRHNNIRHSDEQNSHSYRCLLFFSSFFPLSVSPPGCSCSHQLIQIYCT